MIRKVLFLFAAAALAAADTPSQLDTRALQYAKDFTNKFVQNSCTQRVCEFVPGASHVEESLGLITVELEGQRRMTTSERIEQNEVTAKFVLRPYPDGATFPYGMVLLDFRFAVGREIPYPTR